MLTAAGGDGADGLSPPRSAGKLSSSRGLRGSLVREVTVGRSLFFSFFFVLGTTGWDAVVVSPVRVPVIP